MSMCIPDFLDDACSKIASDGFWLGFKLLPSHGAVAKDKSRIETAVAQAYSNTLSQENARCVVNPKGLSTMLYRVKPKTVAAYPVHSQSDISRFYASTSRIDNLHGIVLVSHKLKMVSFVRSCGDTTQKLERHYALWFHATMQSNAWQEWSGCVKSIQEFPHFIPNNLHASYSRLFSIPRASDVYPYEICLDIEDHFKNELLYEKICVDREIYKLNDTIERVKSEIKKKQQDLVALEKNILDVKSSLSKYEVDLYASRVQVDLN